MSCLLINGSRGASHLTGIYYMVSPVSMTLQHHRLREIRQEKMHMHTHYQPLILCNRCNSLFEAVAQSVNIHKNRWNVPKNRCSIGQRASLCVSSYIYFHFLSFPREIKLDQLWRSTNASICTTYLPTKRDGKFTEGTT